MIKAVDWSKIRVFKNSQNDAFEELVCQLARVETIPGKVDFYRVAAPDGGVEAYCVKDDGYEVGWQAKYFSSMGTSQWNQISESFKTALKTHPRLVKYYVCVPLDRSDLRIKGKKSFMDKWIQFVENCQQLAKDDNRDVRLEYWGSSELIHRLSLSEHSGRQSYWFGGEEFSDRWFLSNANQNIANLGERFSPDLNMDLEISSHFDAISRNKIFRDQLTRLIQVFRMQASKLRNKLPVEKRSFYDETLSILDDQLNRARSDCLATVEGEQIDIACNRLSSLMDEFESSFSKSVSTVEDFREANYALTDFIVSSEFAVADLPVLVVTGNAGIGKSHLLGKLATDLTTRGRPCLLMLGQHFTSDKSPWTQILDDILRLKLSKDEFLGALNARGEAEGERLLVMIDAINEGRGYYFWKDFLLGFVLDFRRYPWLGLILTLRTSYVDRIAPWLLDSREHAIEVEHIGFAGIESKAASKYFKRYGITAPATPLLHAEYSNPLFLKLLCEGLARAGLHSLPRGHLGITKIMNFLFAGVEKKLSGSTCLNYDLSLGLVKRVVSALVKFKVAHSVSYVGFDEACRQIDQHCLPIRSDVILNALISEGVLSKNIFYLESGDSEEGIYFAYERFEDHLAAQSILETAIESKGRTVATKLKKVLAKHLSNGALRQGTLEALAIQSPERFGLELYEILPLSTLGHFSVVRGFVYSISWRRGDTLKSGTIPFVNTHVLTSLQGLNLFLDAVISVAADSDNLFNADGLHEYLIQYELNIRDSIWTTYLARRGGNESAVARLIEWVTDSDNRKLLSTTTRTLLCKVITWVCATTNQELRDRATLALSSLFENNLSMAHQILRVFVGLNDPYVFERLLAAIYGGLLRSSRLNGLATLCNFLFDMIFKQPEVYPNVLIRDFARNIVEFAMHLDVIVLADPNSIRPPYRSVFPTAFPSNKEIDKYRDRALRSTDQNNYRGAGAILRSMVTEYGGGIGGYGDFGRYTFQSKLSSWSKFDPQELSNWACELIFTRYGYRSDLHGAFDSSAGGGDRHRNTVERIGKKYQWLALYEVLARVADNHKMDDPTSRRSEQAPSVWYEGPWYPFVRNCDPTIDIPIADVTPHATEAWWLHRSSYDHWIGEYADWLADQAELPDPISLIEVTDPDGADWLVMETHRSWHEPLSPEHETPRLSHKHLWYQVRSYFVSEEEAGPLVAWAQKQHFMGRWMPESSEQYQIFAREYFWSPAYRYFDKEYFGRVNWENVREEGNSGLVVGQVMPSVEAHRWESGEHPDGKLNYFSPRELMVNSLGLRMTDKLGEWANENGELVCFDPSVRFKNAPSCLLLKKVALTKFLMEKKMKMFWTILGQKQILGDGFIGSSISRKWLEVSGVVSLDEAGLSCTVTPRLVSPSSGRRMVSVR